jgi:hypothetical protein
MMDLAGKWLCCLNGRLVELAQDGVQWRLWYYRCYSSWYHKVSCLARQDIVYDISRDLLIPVVTRPMAFCRHLVGGIGCSNPAGGMDTLFL